VARPRDARIDDTVLPVALQLLLDHGLHGLNLVDVAARSGVGRQSIYRRWADKRALAHAALDSVTVTLPEPTGEDLRSRLVSLLESVDFDLVGRRLGRLLGRLSDGAEDRELLTLCQQKFILPRRNQLIDELRRGIEKGEISAHTDVNLLADVLTGSLLMPSLSSHPAPSSRPSAADVVDLVLDGARRPRAPRA
jgi:AcrR family transcriptional regulator